jgi:two-component system response regulator DctR
MTSEETIYLCDDDENVRGGLAFMLQQCGIQVCAFASGPELLAAVDSAAKPIRGIFILDLEMTPMAGEVVHAELRARGLGERNPILFLSGHGTIEIAVGEVKKGALDFVRKPFAAEALLNLIRMALDRERLMHAESERRDHLQSLIDSLSRQQLRVFPFVAGGGQNKVIARDLQLHVRSVEDHKKKLFDKLGITNGEEAATILAEMRRFNLALERAPDAS